MKKITLILVVASVIIMILFAGCEKIPKPYLKKWTGTYECEVNGSTWYFDLDGGYTEYYTYQTEVTVTAKIDSILLIYDTESDDSYEVKANRLGYFSAPQNHGSIQGTFFETDSIKMSIMYGMQGFSVSKNFKGKKIKK